MPPSMALSGKTIIETLPNGIDFIIAGSVPLIPYAQVLLLDNNMLVNSFLPVETGVQ